MQINPEKITLDKKRHSNRKRGAKISGYARKNAAMYKKIDSFMIQSGMDGLPLLYFMNLRASLQKCCQHTLLRKHHQPNTIEFIASHTCKHKLCNICNYSRSRDIRRKYRNYFSKNEIVDMKTGELFTRDDFDFMHLTLTVPHTDKGWRGKKFYAAELMKEYNFMRKKKFWKEQVFAGEFGVEITRNESGLHIHIHSLLLVRKSKGSRNKLYQDIFGAWNQQTASGVNDKFTPEQVAGIRKSFKSMPGGQFDDFIRNLNPSGSTLIGLESLYVLSNSGKKRYVNASNESDLMAGIMECIKYHFEPNAVNSATGDVDFALLAEILPNIYRKPLYRKFGAFHGLKELNIQDTETETGVLETFSETASDQITHPITGAVQERSDYSYIVTHAKNIYYDSKKGLTPHLKRSAKVHRLGDCNTVSDALIWMLRRSIEGRERARRIQEIIHEQLLPDENEFQAITAA
jgi:hypothetical protein